MDKILEILAESSLRALLIAAAVAVVLRGMGVRSSTVRHGAWAGVLLAMLFLPLLSLYIPRISIPILPPYPHIQERQIWELAKSTTANLEWILPKTKSVNSGLRSSAQPSPPPLAVKPSKSGLSAYQAAGILYLVGFAVFMARLLLGMLISFRLGHHALPCDKGFYVAQCNAPLTLGLLRPRILLPLESKHWNEDKLASVLIHEQTHVRRKDPLMEWFSVLNRSIYWFHPLAWWLPHKLSELAEQACDEAVIEKGCDRGEYAELLVELAHSVKERGILTPNWGSSIKGGALMRRIQKITTSDLNQKISRTRLILVAILCAGVILVPAFGKLIPTQEYASQNAVYLLSKGIDAEENLMDLDRAMEYYRKVLSTPADDRVYAAYAQFRLSQISLLKGNLAAAAKELNNLALNYPEYNDLVSQFMAEDQTGIFHSPRSFQISTLPIGSTSGDRYHHNLSGLEFSLQNWTVVNESGSSGGGQIISLQNLASEALQVSVWVKPDRISPADIPSRLRGSAHQKILQRLSYLDYRMPQNAFRPSMINGKQALSVIANYRQQDNTRMIEYLTWIYSEATRVQFFARFRESDFQSYKPLFDELVSTAIVR